MKENKQTEESRNKDQQEDKGRSHISKDQSGTDNPQQGDRWNNYQTREMGSENQESEKQQDTRKERP